MKALVVLAAMFCGGWACAQTAWFTVVGDRHDPAVNTVEVDPVPLSVQERQRTMRVRVNRSEPRTSWDAVPYRSYVSEVVFDCARKTARYTSLVFYQQPLWVGESHRTSTYTEANPRWMQFRDMFPNPTARLIRAACETGKVART